jgi:hypothetical protein
VVESSYISSVLSGDKPIASSSLCFTKGERR